MSAAAQPSHDRNLLFGMLALQLDFLTRDQLIDALHAWVLAKDRPLAQLLTERGSLAASRCALLEALVHEHLAQHQGDPQQSLASLSAVGSVREALAQIEDEDVQASLRHVASGRPVPTEDPYATQDHTPSASTVPVRYLMLRPHAKGGLGEVFVAQDQELHREVALKEIQEHHADDPDSRARFVLEAEITGGLEHPGIVPVYGLGAYADGRPYYAMRFIRGDSLKDAIKRFHRPGLAKRTPGERTLELRRLLGRFIDVCNALAYAHSRGVLHRDLKPGNIMLGKYGETLVVDWGLAKTLGQAEPGTGSERPLLPAAGLGATPTVMGSRIGTPAYMSPEQAAGRLDLLGPASDIYSLGATLYHLLTGQPPVTGRDAGEIAGKVARGEIVPPRQANARTPPALAAVCLKALALKPADRYASALALATDVEHWLADEPVSAWPEPLSVRAYRWVKRHRTSVTGAVAAVTVAAVVLAGATVLLTAAYEGEATARHEESAAKVKERQTRLVAQQQEAEAILQRDKARQYFAKARDAVDNMLTRVSEDKELLRHEPRMEEIRRLVLEDALAYYQDFLKEKSTDPGLRNETASAHLRLGKVQYELGKSEEAERSYRAALKLFQQLADDFPQVTDYRSYLARSHNNLAVLLEKTERAWEAEASVREALKLRQQLADDFPRVPDYRSNLASSHNNLAVLLNRMGRAREAKVPHRAALKLLRQLADDFPKVPDYRSNLALSHNNLGYLLAKSGRANDAEQEYLSALKFRQLLVDDFPNNPRYREDQALDYHELALFLQKRQRLPEAETWYHAAIGLRKQLAEEFPKEASIQSDLAASLNNLGVLTRDRADLPAAKKHMEQSITHHQAAVALAPKQADYRNGLARNHRHLADILVRLHNHQDATKAAAEVLRCAPTDWQDYHRSALFTCQAIPLATKDAKLTDAQRKDTLAAYGAQAVRLLQQAVAQGYADAAALQQEPAFAPLRDRPDFQQLLSQLDGKTR